MEGNILCMQDFMEVVAMFRCKFCSTTFHSTSDLTIHVKEIHSFQVKDTPMEEKTELIFVEEQESSIQHTALGFHQSHMKEDEDEHAKEVYLCGQCNKDFATMKHCKTHMELDHHVLVSTTEISTLSPGTSEITATYDGQNRISVGIQACTTKRPGRKPKQHHSKSPSQELPEILDSDEEMILEEEDPEEIGRDFLLESNRELQGKRKTRLPKALLDDYYIGRKRYKQKEHIDKGNQNFPFKCDIKGCYFKFKTCEKLTMHRNCHLPKVIKDEAETNMQETSTCSFACFECVTLFMDWKACCSHLWQEHSLDVGIHKCAHCDFRCESSANVKLHETKQHSSQKSSQQVECPECGKSLRSHASLHTHIINRHKQPNLKQEKNIQERWYNKKTCQTCNRIFANSKSLRNHIETVHSKLKPFACPYCDHTCARKAMLDTHVRTHTGDRPFACDQCNYATNDHNTLRRHKLRHTGIKPYACQYCPYSCIQAISLKSHMKNKHPGMEGVFSCDQCQYRSVNKKYYNNHMNDHRLGLIPSFSEDSPPPPKRPLTRPQPKQQQLPKVSSSMVRSGNQHELLYQALTESATQQEQQEQQEQEQQHTITLQHIASDGGSDGVVYSMLAGHDEQGVLYLQQTEDGGIDSSGLQHIITAIQNSETTVGNNTQTFTINLNVNQGREELIQIANSEEHEAGQITVVQEQKSRCPEHLRADPEHLNIDTEHFSADPEHLSVESECLSVDQEVAGVKTEESIASHTSTRVDGSSGILKTESSKTKQFESVNVVSIEADDKQTETTPKEGSSDFHFQHANQEHTQLLLDDELGECVGEVQFVGEEAVVVYTSAAEGETVTLDLQQLTAAGIVQQDGDSIIMDTKQLANYTCM